MNPPTNMPGDRPRTAASKHRWNRMVLIPVSYSAQAPLGMSRVFSLATSCDYGGTGVGLAPSDGPRGSDPDRIK